MKQHAAEDWPLLRPTTSCSFTEESSSLLTTATTSSSASFGYDTERGEYSHPNHHHGARQSPPQHTTIGSFHHKLIICGHRLQWLLGTPWRLPVFPRHECFSELPHVSYGQLLAYTLVLLQIPWAVYHVGIVHAHRPAFQVILSGVWATLALWIAFFLAHKRIMPLLSSACCCSSTSFDRAISLHQLASEIAVGLGIGHAVLAFWKWGNPLKVVLEHPPEEESSDIFQVVSYNDSTHETVLVPLVSTHYTLYSTHHQTSLLQILRWSVDGWINQSGTGLLLSMMVLVGSSTAVAYQLRRRWYAPWFVLHILASVLVVICGWYHFRLGLPILVLWVVDGLMRVGAGCQTKSAKTNAVTARQIPNTNVVCLSWSRSRAWNYEPGQFVKIGWPVADRFVFHPMSIASSPCQTKVFVYIRALGPWTKVLFQMSSEGQQLNSALVSKTSTGYGKQKQRLTQEQKLNLVIEGPYGSMEIPLYQAQKHVLLCISGGVGVSPCLSIARWLLARNQVAKLLFVWSIREWELVEAVLPVELWDDPRQIDDIATDLNENENRLVETYVYHTTATSGPPIRRTSTTVVIPGQRPTWDKLFEKARLCAQQLGYHRVSVVCCGPMQEDIQRACRQHSCSLGGKGYGKRVVFDLHDESFEF